MSTKNLGFVFFLLAFTLLVASCDDDPDVDGDLTSIPYSPVSYDPNIPSYLPKLTTPADNPLTVDGINLGRHLFYDNILSGNGTMSCASCHHPDKAFTDGLPVSFGIDGIGGRRSSMSLVNVGFTKNGLFWDGRSPTLETQALLPVTDPIELHANWPDIENKLRNHEDYPTLFRKAFGIKNKSEITKELAAKSLAQFQRIILSINSKYDRVVQGKEKFDDLELIGFSLFIDLEGSDLPDAECHHCHTLDLATADAFFNNGLQASSDLNGFKDAGRGAVTGHLADNGKMRAPTLRNIMFSAPYMHDGSLKSIDEVLNHYNGHGKSSPNKDPLIRNLELTPFHKEALVAFLNTLTDTSYLQNPLLKKPN
ncbi:MAG: cytochrome C peroxidase [Saprospiraceae bacterium]|nr:cytochrome C peroxidase [Saprospiraceae bacterium]MBK8112657.1 cytochrome C peroxidase [Saprospiraceae bacterium]MBK8852226.1 cytochrome C peroxidase [Saprospiraceae bacterium]